MGRRAKKPLYTPIIRTPPLGSNRLDGHCRRCRDAGEPEYHPSDSRVDELQRRRVTGVREDDRCPTGRRRRRQCSVATSVRTEGDRQYLSWCPVGQRQRFSIGPRCLHNSGVSDTRKIRV